MELLGRYRNGNYDVEIYDDGTKIRQNDLDHFAPEFPESMDIKITDSCNMLCGYCHENSLPNGKHGDILHLPFLKSLHPVTELAIGGGNPLSHPDLIPFLRLCKERNLIANITVNQRHFLMSKDTLLQLSMEKLIWGLGVSLRHGMDDDERNALIEALKLFPNAVIHAINGIHTVDELHSMAFNDFKLLILGYKEFRRGKGYYLDSAEEIYENQKQLFDKLPAMILDDWFSAISFDNLAINQLDVRGLMSDDEWAEFYMGDDGRDGEFTSASMYIDAVKMEFAKNSCSEERFPVTNNVTEMYRFLKYGGANGTF